jgi:hypothetical protein
MIISLILSLIAIASGATLTYAYDNEAPLAARLCSGACIGIALMGLIGFLFASIFGLNDLSIGLTVLVLALPVIAARKPQRRTAINADIKRATESISHAISRPDRWDLIYFLFYAVVFVVMWDVFSRAFLEKPDGFYTGVLNNFGDLPFHISVITRFAYGQNFPPEDPTFAGARFTYPFMTDFISAMFLRVGASIRESMFIENWILGVAMVGVLHRFGQELLRNRTAAIITPVLVILSGGLGWTMLFGDVHASGGSIFHVLRHLPHAYTILPEVANGWRWGNAMTTLLVPQRGFLLGIPLAVIVFTQLWTLIRGQEGEGEGKRKKEKGKREAETKSAPAAATAKHANGGSSGSSLFPFSFFLLPFTRRMLAAGLVAGLLPLVHAHSFISVMLVGTALAVLNWSRWREWLIFLVVASIVAGPQMLWATHGTAVSTSSFIGWEIGWDHGNESVAWFWFKNTGLFIPLLMVTLLWKRDEYLVPRKLLLFYLPFTLCFIIPNFVKLAPWIWDNIKILFYWWIGSAPIVALLLARLWEGRTSSRVLAAALFVALTLAGGLDVFAIVTHQGEYQVFDRKGITFADQIRQSTPARSMILHPPIHNTPIFLTGRRSLLGYPGHIWTHGIDYGPREADLKKIYSGSLDAGALLRNYGVDYVVIDPALKPLMPVNEAFFSHYPLVVKTGEYRLFKVTP